MSERAMTLSQRKGAASAVLAASRISAAQMRLRQSPAGGECEECKSKKDLVQRKPASTGPIREIPPIVHEVLGSPGQPLDAETRGFMESRFGQDFSAVRLHTDDRARVSADAVQARAYTAGRTWCFEPAGRSHRTPKIAGCSRTSLRMSCSSPGRRGIGDRRRSGARERARSTPRTRSMKRARGPRAHVLRGACRTGGEAGGRGVL